VSGLPPPLTAVQLLWLNLVTNGIQDVALAFERGEPGILARRPRPAPARVFDRQMIEQVAVGGLSIGLIAFFYYWSALAAGATHEAAQGATLWLLVWCENAHCFNCRSETRSIFKIPLTHNPLLIGGVIGTQALQFAALEIAPLRDLLSLRSVGYADGLSLAFAGAVVLTVMELGKLLRRRAG
jgi:magnesium-transporting ATPase (P-type)